jgi:hypothetical protein
VNTGKIGFYGKPYSKTVARLMETAAVGATSIKVDNTLIAQWAVGD